MPREAKPLTPTPLPGVPGRGAFGHEKREPMTALARLTRSATTRILANAATFYWQGTYETVI
jgi:hypothetical protein